MAEILFDGSASALHPHLAGAAALGRWPASGALHIERALAPGLTSELAPFARSLPHMIGAGDAPPSLMWGCEFPVPPDPDPQYPLCMHALVRLVERDVPRLITAMTGREYAYAAPGRLRVWLLRKGCYLESAPADGALRFYIGLTATQWPAGWGGHLEAVDHRDRAITSMSPAGDTLAVFAGRGPRIPLVTRHVEGLLVAGELVPA